MVIRELAMPFQVSWDIVHRCNLRCRHCYFTAEQLSDPAALSRADALDFVRYLGEKKVFHLSLAGGEPLLCPHLEEVIAEATRQKIVVALSTNAILLTAERARLLRSAGLKSLQISFDGPDAPTNDLVRGRGSFEETLRGFRIAVASGFDVLIAIVLMQTNRHSVTQVFEFAYSEGATGVKVQTLIESGLGALNYANLSIPEPELVELIQKLWSIKASWTKKLKLILPLVPNIQFTPQEAPEYYYQDRSCHGCQPGLSTIRVSNAGNVRACGAQVSGDGDIGNILTIPLQQIWKESQELVRWRNEATLRSGSSATACGSICGKGCRSSSAPAFAKNAIRG